MVAGPRDPKGAMDFRARSELFACPRCSASIAVEDAAFRCLGCGHAYPIEDGIPALFCPNEWGEGKDDVTDRVRSFYEETPFPNYDDFDSVASLAAKARGGRFARLLDEQLPPNIRIIECGSGTAQLSNFLSLANRTVFATDLCMNSLRIGRDFAERHGLDRVGFVQMNLFRPAFRPGSFHLVVSNGVLHHTSDPFGAFRSISGLVKPGGYVLVGLYHRYGRLVTDARRVLFRLSGDRFQWLDPNLRRESTSAAKKRAWFADQYQHPHESKHTIGEVLGWLDAVGLRFVKSIPISRPFRTFADDERLFAPEPPGNALERTLVELGMITSGSREGGFFIVIAQRPPETPAPSA
ncbi:MAG: 2-polyprenyl-3-methyl-5-hydroxy-6-metoxy-1,4-benzoquinol methylase [Proteobacteria bacterium]|nr:MAG: 2-polyprenyl-3-methyl-5-hydroxy-6-metoxy-1,4-benzoquinol methylase [Pseudomonadota bacterium]